MISMLLTPIMHDSQQRCFHALCSQHRLFVKDILECMHESYHCCSEPLYLLYCPIAVAHACEQNCLVTT